MSDKQPPVIEATGFQKRFGELHVLKDANLSVERHEVVALFGPSGSGKSTFLRCLNLLERPDAGTLARSGRDVAYRELSASDLSRHRAEIGMVFQHFNLFPHLDVMQNVMEAPLRVLRRPRAEAQQKAEALLEQVGLSDKLHAWPEQLSGGQQQRVAIARALAMEPEILLLDEVTSALDVEMVAGINELLCGLAAEGMTMIAVTHDLAFARQVADRVCFFDQGRVAESGPTAETLDTPRSGRLREFLGAMGERHAGGD